MPKQLGLVVMTVINSLYSLPCNRDNSVVSDAIIMFISLQNCIQARVHQRVSAQDVGVLIASDDNWDETSEVTKEVSKNVK